MTQKTSKYTRKRMAQAKQCGEVRPPSKTAWLHLITRVQTFEPGELMEQHNITSIALERLRNGVGGRDDFDRVAMTLNIGLVLAEGMHQSLVDLMINAQAAMVRMQDRHKRGMSLAFDAGGLKCVRPALDAYEDMADKQSAMQLSVALCEAYRRSTNGQVLTVDWAKGVAA